MANFPTILDTDGNYERTENSFKKYEMRQNNSFKIIGEDKYFKNTYVLFLFLCMCN